MADGGQDPSDWLQGFLSNDQVPSNYGQDQGLEFQANAVFAEAARVAQQEHEAYLRFQRTASQYQSQQASHEDMSFWPPLEDTQSENLAQSQLPYLSQYSKQPCDAPDQQHRFVRPSDINPWSAPRPAAPSLSRTMGAQPQAFRAAIEQQRQSHADHQAANQGRSGSSYGHSDRSQAASLPSDNRHNPLHDAGFRPESFPSTSPKYDQYTSATRSTLGHPPPALKDSATAANSSQDLSAGESQTRAPIRNTPKATPRPISAGGDMTRGPRPSTSGLPEVRKPSATAKPAACSPPAPPISTAPMPPAVPTAGAYSSYSTGTATNHHLPSSKQPPVSNGSKNPTPSLQSGQFELPSNLGDSPKHASPPASATSAVNEGHPPGRPSASNSGHLNSHPDKASPPATSSAGPGWEANQSTHQDLVTLSQPTPTLPSRFALAGPQVANAPAPSLAVSQQQATHNYMPSNQSSLQHQQRPVDQTWNKSFQVPHPTVQKVPYQQSRPNGNMPKALYIPKKRPLSDASGSGFDPQAKKTFDASKFLHAPASRKNLSHRMDLARPLRFEDAIARETYNPATIAKNVLISSGRHRNEPRLNEHLEPLLKNTMVNGKTDLNTVRWDILDPIAPSHRPLPPTRPLGVENRDKTPNQPSPLFHAHPPTSSSIASGSGRSSLPPPPPRTPALAHQPKSPGKSPTKQRTPKRPQQTPSLTSPNCSVPRKVSQPSPSSQGYPQPQVVIISPRKMPRGRKAVGGLSNGDSGSGAASPKSPPQYQVFPCKWSDCQSELHNLNSLQSHVLKVHIPHHLTCGWAACENTTPMSAADHWEHVLVAHIRPLAWTLGDGPKVSSPANSEEALLRFPSSDSVCRSARTETAVQPADETMVASFTRLRHRIGRLPVADAAEEAIMQWKEKRVAMGPSNPRLSTFARLHTIETREIAYCNNDRTDSDLARALATVEMDCFMIPP